jgi:hypothetical protein
MRVPTAVDPLLWACLIIVPACLGSAYLLRRDEVLRYGLATLGALPVLAVLGAYFYFLIHDRDRLQAVRVKLGSDSKSRARRTYLLVTSLDADWFLPGEDIVDQALDEDDQVFVFAANIAFLQTLRDIIEVTEKLSTGLLLGRNFFLTEIPDTVRTGSMDPQFWDYIEQSDKQAA